MSRVRRRAGPWLSGSSISQGSQLALFLECQTCDRGTETERQTGRDTHMRTHTCTTQESAGDSTWAQRLVVFSDLDSEYKSEPQPQASCVHVCTCACRCRKRQCGWSVFRAWPREQCMRTSGVGCPWCVSGCMSGNLWASGTVCESPCANVCDGHTRASPRGPKQPKPEAPASLLPYPPPIPGLLSVSEVTRDTQKGF